jgi:nucleoid-associated protein YgaU
MMDVDGTKFSGGAASGKGGAGNKNSGRPPTVEFGWGNLITFKAVCDSLQIQYTLFKPDGTPIRANAKLQLTQVGNVTAKPSGGSTKRQNPTTTGVGGLRTHVVRDGDSLQSIAYAAYGDATHWRAIAEANGVDDPTRLRRGALLTIPRLEV